MNKAELAAEIAKRKGLKLRVAKVAVDAVFDEMIKALQRGDKIEIRGFGSFVMRNYGSYQGRNPKTGELVVVPPKKLPYFKVGKELKLRVDRGKKGEKIPPQPAASDQ